MVRTVRPARTAVVPAVSAVVPAFATVLTPTRVTRVLPRRAILSHHVSSIQFGRSLAGPGLPGRKLLRSPIFPGQGQGQLSGSLHAPTHPTIETSRLGMYPPPVDKEAAQIYRACYESVAVR